MRSVLAAVLLAVLVLLVPQRASAFCGFYVSGVDKTLFNKATMVVMMRDHTRTILSMQNNYEGPPSDFAMVIPVPVILQQDNVKTLPRAIFDKVDQLASPRLVEYWEQDPCEQRRQEMAMKAMAAPMASATAAAGHAAADLGVRIEAQFEVGEYQILILSAENAMGLDTWLRQEGYKIPAGAEAVLRPYVAAGTKFFVAKVDTKKLTFDANGRATLSPLRFHYDDPTFQLPIRLGLINSGGVQDLIVHILSRDQRYEVANYPNATIPTNLDVDETARDKFSAIYAKLFDATQERTPHAVVTEYAWSAMSCDPCPGPTLSPQDLATLGADVLPGTGSPLPVMRIASIKVDPPEQKNLVSAAVMSKQLQVKACYESALREKAGVAGDVKLHFTVDKDGAVKGLVTTGSELADASAIACIGNVFSKTTLPTTGADLKKPTTVDVTLNLSVAQPPPQMPWGMVLTRLHARYGKEGVGEDSVFRAAEPIVGGREIPNANGELEKGAQKAPMNNFQARYAIRHPWKGAIACKNPRRGVWGGPPGGVAPASPKAARDLAFAPRGGIELATYVKNDPWTGSGGNLAALGVPGAKEHGATGDPMSAPSGKSGGCMGCATAAGGADIAGVLAFGVGAVGAVVRRRRPRKAA